MTFESLDTVPSSSIFVLIFIVSHRETMKMTSVSVSSVSVSRGPRLGCVSALEDMKVHYLLSCFPVLGPQSSSGLPGHIFSSRSYFFDNPRRYDSDDDLAWSVMPQNIQAR